MRGKLRGFFLMTGALAAISAFSAMAAGWTTDSSGRQVYQNDDGSIVSNSWIRVDNNGKTDWYYARNDGSLRTDGWQRVGDSYYYFDGNGIMQTGWVDEDRYYCDVNTGAMKTGWKQLALPEDTYRDRDGRNESDSYWFYFNTRTGEKFCAENGSVTTKTIDGVVYGFDEYGVMLTGWAETESASPEIAGYMYFAEKTSGKFKMGQRISGTWYATVGPEDGSKDNLSTGDVEWFYFKSNGHPAAGGSTVYSVQKIDGKRFLFNERGNPVFGIQKGAVGDGEEHYYYCGTSRSDCSVKTGKMTVTDGDGEKVVCYFEASGKGLTGIKDGNLYYNGLLQKADKEMKYQKVTLDDGKTYVVNSTGKIMKSKTNQKDGDGVKWSTNASGVITLDEGLYTLELRSPVTTDLE